MPDYNPTLNLPQTDFPMRAGLAKREPEMLKTFYQKAVYETLMKKNAGKPIFVLHDGPPFSNGDLHLGHALNKVLKDIIIRHKNMSGYHAPYTPGWDNHGMPIESAIIKKNKLDHKKMSIPEFRDACHKFAADFVDRQREQFKRLGVIGDWDNPYLTMAPSFEAAEVRVFGKMYEKGYIYKGLKPVYWCTHDETALAEAEIEYANDPCKAIYVKFKVKDSKGALDGIPGGEDAYILIWTTTTWTLPGNLAISLGPDIEYSVCRANGEVYIVASKLAEEVFDKAGIKKYEILRKLPGKAFERMTAHHPFYDRESLVVVGDHVTTEAGTGCVHTAPAHGVDDFNVCAKYPELKTVMSEFVPVDSRGIMTDAALQYAGQHYSKVVDVINEDLQNSGALFAYEDIEHSYPHCWRCKSPIIYRATEQWFASVDAMKDTAVAACEDIKWIPEWGKDRMIAMIVERADWCISRQRNWGLPIPVFYCGQCEKPVCTPESIEAVAEVFAQKGSNAWYALSPEEILPQNFTCPHCGVAGAKFTAGQDSLDCWFDSGSTHAAVLRGQFPDLHFPADIYLEGGDQYRGWFQSSMLTSIAVNGVAPYKRIITNGWTLDGEGKAMHKSLGNAISPDEVTKEYGADVLRLWISSTDYRTDVRLSKDMLKQLSDSYLKIRNTARFILGNLNGFDPKEHMVAPEDMTGLDLWALSRLGSLINSVNASYERYEYHTIYHGIHNFCTVDMSNFYLDIIKDRLYCDEADGAPRRAAQTAIYLILDALVRMLAPILAFTSEEIWSAMTHGVDVELDSVLYNQMPRADEKYSLTPEQAAKWDKLLRLRADVNKALELARADKVIGKPLDAEVTLFVDSGAAEAFSEIAGEDLKTLFIVSKVEIVNGGDNGDGYSGTEFPGVTVSVKPSEAPKCARCWVHDEGVGQASEYPDLCPRCFAVVSSGGGKVC